MNSSPVAVERAVHIPRDGVQGDLVIPEHAFGIVIFAHGSGSSRHSSRNRYVAGVLQQGGLATLLMDLLTSDEEQADMRTGQLRFDIPLLARRLVDATDWAASQPETRELNIGYFGASTGAGAALVAASGRPSAIGAVVSRGGRPDLAGEALPLVKAPTLLIVGSLDAPVIELNQRAQRELRPENRLEIIPGATHLFEEPGTLERVADLARSWFESHLQKQPQE
jgi:putative phosphoribosyl transferase